jgi:hypothetical protein
MVSVKLNQENYLLWTTQVLTYLHNQGLAGHINGSLLAPQQTISSQEVLGNTDDHTIIVNPKFTSWYH